MYICEILTSLLFIYRMGRKHRLTNPRKNEERKKYAARQLLVSIPLSAVSVFPVSVSHAIHVVVCVYMFRFRINN